MNKILKQQERIEAEQLGGFAFLWYPLSGK
jgi:hypothetical protein